MAAVQEEYSRCVSRTFAALLCLTGNRAAASDLTKALLPAIAQKMILARHPHQFGVWLARLILQTFRKFNDQPEHERTTEGAPAAVVALQTLDPVVRAWAALRLGARMSSRGAADALDLRPRDVTRVEEQITNCFMGMESYSRFANHQSTLEQAIVEELEAVPLPEEITKQMSSAWRAAADDQKSGSQKLFKPIMIAGGLSLAVIVVLLISSVVGRISRFEGYEQVARVLALAEESRPALFAEVAAGPDGFEDWLFLNTGNGAISLPEKLQDVPVRFARKVSVGDLECIHALPQRDDLAYFIFDLGEAAVSLPEGVTWVPIEAGEWVGALKRDGERGVMIGVRADRPRLEGLISD